MKDEGLVDHLFIETLAEPVASGFGSVSANAIDELAKLGQLLRIAPNSIFITEGDMAETVYILLEGRVKVFSESDGREMVMNVCGPGDILGELALDGGLRTASAMAMDNVRCAVITRQTLREAVSRDPDLAWKIISLLISLLISRARLATTLIKDLALHDVYQRVTHLLQSMSKLEGGVMVLSERLSQQEIANRVGASRDMVTRVMRELVKGGYVEMDHKLIKLNKPLPARW